MPYVNIRITREGATPGQKARLIRGVTDLLAEILDKNPVTTFVVIDEVDLQDWGIAGMPVETFRKNVAANRDGPNRAAGDGQGS